jgi:O-antigen ligase
MSDSLAPVEYGYYFVMFYTAVGGPLGLILIGGIGSGFLLIPLLGWCAIALGPSFLSILRSAWIPLACGASYLIIQLILHGEALHTLYVYQFGPWILSLVIVQALAIYRTDFLHRFAWFTILIGLAMLPFLSFRSDAGYVRAGLETGVGLAYSNPNALGGWFGFCLVYLTIKGYVETRPVYRLAAWVMAVGSLYVVTLAVSRAALLAATVSLLVASRRLLKAGFLPVLLLAGLLIGLREIGVFDEAIDAFSRRGMEDTGRLQVWPLLIEKFINSPFIGYGASKVGTVTATGAFRTPHNGFLLIAVASGIVPLLLFCAYCYRSGMAAWRANAADQDFMFYLPLVVYTLLMASSGNGDFTMPWAIVSLAVPVVAVYRVHQD